MTMADPAEEPAGREEARKMFLRIGSGGSWNRASSFGVVRFER